MSHDPYERAFNDLLGANNPSEALEPEGRHGLGISPGDALLWLIGGNTCGGLVEVVLRDAAEVARRLKDDDEPDLDKIESLACRLEALSGLHALTRRKLRELYGDTKATLAPPSSKKRTRSAGGAS